MGNICIKGASVSEQEIPLYTKSGVEIFHSDSFLYDSYDDLEDYYTKKHNDLIASAYLFSVI